MASTPASLPSLGLLDGLGAPPAGSTDSPAPLPSLALLGGFGEAVAAVSEPGLVWLEGNPLAWLVDPGFAAAYAFQPVGISQANRDDVAESSGNQGGDPAPLPHLGLLLAPSAVIPTPAAAAGSYAETRKRRFIAKIGDKLVITSASKALQALEATETPADEAAPQEQKTEEVAKIEVPIKAMKAQAKVFKQDAAIVQMIKRAEYEAALELYERLKRQQDEEDVELLLMAL